MSAQTDWLVKALNNVAINPAVITAATVGTLNRDPDDDGGRYGGGEADYSVWK